MRKLRKEGLLYQKIADRFGLSNHTAYYWCNEKYRKCKQLKSAKRKYPKGVHVRMEVEGRRRRWKEYTIDYIIDAVQTAKDEKRCKRHTVFGKPIEEWDEILKKYKTGGQKVF